MIRKVLPFFTLFLPLFSFAQSEIFFEHSIRQAKEEKKPILLVFSGSDWCKACMNFDKEILSDQSIYSELNQTFVIHIADFPRGKGLSKEKIRDNEALAEQFNPQGYFPLIIALDSDLNHPQQIDYKPGQKKAFLNHLSASLKID